MCVRLQDEERNQMKDLAKQRMEETHRVIKDGKAKFIQAWWRKQLVYLLALRREIGVCLAGQLSVSSNSAVVFVVNSTSVASPTCVHACFQP